MRRRVIGALLALLAPAAPAQSNYIISTVMGSGKLPFAGHGGPATSAVLVSPEALASDGAGNLYLTDLYYHRVFRIDAAGVIRVFAGNGAPGFSGDGGPAIDARLNLPGAVIPHPDGRLLIGDSGNACIRAVAPNGTISTIAGAGRQAAADGVLATDADFGAAGGVIGGLIVDGSARVVFSTLTDSRIWRIEADGRLRVVAGTGQSGFSGDGGAARSAQLSGPKGLALDRDGNLYFADQFNYRIRRIALDGSITTHAGIGQIGDSGDGGQARQARIGLVQDIVFDGAGNLIFTDYSFGKVRQVNTAGGIITIAGTTLSRSLMGPAGMTIDASGRLLVAASQGRAVVRVVASQSVSVVAGSSNATAPGDGGLAVNAALIDPTGVAVDSQGNVYVADYGDHRVRQVLASNRTARTIAGSGAVGYAGDGGQAAQATIGNPQALHFGPTGDLLISFFHGSGIRRIHGGVIDRVAGGSSLGYAGDGGNALVSLFNGSNGFATDADGNIYMADQFNHRLRRISTTGVVVTLAGSGVEGYSGDRGPVLAARLSQPTNIAISPITGEIYIADEGNRVIRRIDRNLLMSTFFGDAASGVQGDPGRAVFSGLDFDGSGNLYVASSTLNRIWRITPERVATVIAGTGAAGFSGDGGDARNAQIAQPRFLTVTSEGDIYFVDAGNSRVRRLTAVENVPPNVVHAASFLGGGVAPGQIATFFTEVDSGPQQLTTAALDASGRIATTLAGTRVFFDDLASPLIYTSQRQISVVVPYGIAGRAQVRVHVEYQGSTTVSGIVNVVAAAPGIFTYTGGAGQAVIVNEDRSFNSSTNRAATGSIAVVFVTGEGVTTPAGVDGRIAVDILPAPVALVEVFVGGVRAEVIYAGAAPGVVAGVMQVNFRIPAMVAPSAASPLSVRVGGTPSQNGVTMAVR